MQTLQTMLNLITPSCWMTKLDLADAFLVVKIREDHTDFLKFKFDGFLWKYLVMCFGYHASPRKFTKLLHPVLVKLHQEGHKVGAYLDDSLQVGYTIQESLAVVTRTHNLLISLGFILNYKKSCLIPSQKLNILGFSINSINMTITLTEDKKDKLLHLFKHVVEKPSMTVHQLAKVVGKMISCFPTLPAGRLYYRPLERKKVAALAVNPSFDGKVKLGNLELKCVHWWIQAIP